MKLWCETRASCFFLLGLFLGLWGCAPEGDFGPASGSEGANLAAPGEYEAQPSELEVHDQVNDYRLDEGLDPTLFEDLVGAVARTHSEDMAQGNVTVGHDGFEARAQDIMDQLDDVSNVGENVGRITGADTQEEAVEAVLDYWRNSPDHDENLLHKDWILAGVGVAQDDQDSWFFTQVFVGTQ